MNDLTDLPDFTPEELSKHSPIELTDLLIEHEDRSPRCLIEECARRGEVMVTHLHSLHDCDFLWQHDAGSGVWWLRLHAAMILGWIPSESAGLLLVELMRRMSQEGDNDLQDWLAGYWPALFRNKPGSVMPTMRLLAKDKTLGWYMRVNAMEATLGTASRQGDETLEQTLAWLAALAADESEDMEFRLSAANYLLDFPRGQYRSLLESLEAQQTGLGKHFDRHSIEQAYAGHGDSPQWTRVGHPWKFYDPEIIAHRQQRWREEDEKEKQRILNEDADYPDDPYDRSYDNEPYIRQEPKIGRNDLCPCGSGKKYKKCCLPKNE